MYFIHVSLWFVIFKITILLHYTQFVTGGDFFCLHESLNYLSCTKSIKLTITMSRNNRVPVARSLSEPPWCNSAKLSSETNKSLRICVVFNYILWGWEMYRYVELVRITVFGIKLGRNNFTQIIKGNSYNTN